MTTVYVATAGAGKRMLAVALSSDAVANGWRPVVWTDRLGRAEKFDAPDDAEAWARSVMPRGGWAVEPRVGTIGPNCPDGGTALAMRAVA